jgi:hypothetical protein
MVKPLATGQDTEPGEVIVRLPEIANDPVDAVDVRVPLLTMKFAQVAAVAPMPKPYEPDRSNTASSVDDGAPAPPAPPEVRDQLDAKPQAMLLPAAPAQYLVGIVTPPDQQKLLHPAAR